MIMKQCDCAQQLKVQFYVTVKMITVKMLVVGTDLYLFYLLYIVEYCMVTVIAVSRTISVCSCVLQQRTTKMCDRNTRKPRKFKQTNGRLRSFRGVLGPGSDMSEERMTTLLSQLFIFFFTIFGVCFQGRFNTHQIVFSSEYEAPTWRYSFEKVRPQHKHTQVQQHLHDETKNKEISP